MNFWNDRELAARFSEGRVPAKERLYYLLLSVGLTMAVSSSFVIRQLYPETINAYDIVLDITAMVAMLAGTWLCWRVNQKGDGQEFIERYICLGLPILIRTVVVLLLVVFILGLIQVLIVPESELSEATNFYDIIFIVFSLLFFFYRLVYATAMASKADVAFLKKG